MGRLPRASWVVSGLVCAVTLAPMACDNSCRSLHDGVNANCAPVCETVGDCEEGEVCVEDRLDPPARFCAEPCTSSTNGCECECADANEGFCGTPDQPSLACRGERDLTKWTEFTCSCEARGDIPAFDDCKLRVANEIELHFHACADSLEAAYFCLYRAMPYLNGDIEACEVPEAACAEQLGALAECEAG